MGNKSSTVSKENHIKSKLAKKIGVAKKAQKKAIAAGNQALAHAYGKSVAKKERKFLYL